MATDRHVAIRPLLFDRLRLYLGGEAEYIASVFDDEEASLYRDLERLKGPDSKIAVSTGDGESIKEELVHVIDARKDITTGLLDEHMEYLKVRLYRGGQADTIRDILLERQETLLDDLGKLREQGLTEDNEQIMEVRERINWIIRVLRDLGTVLVNLAGPDRDPR